MKEPILDEDHIDAKPPVLGSWNNVYALVIGFLIFLILIFTFLTKVLE
ncbi:hypothetical protein SAMN06298216_0123 [Spirosomataceae bacterium TFI 002]|nr:hypothetical protein SAMN06298216_0123 [Spirosomataceae bacterium TFI 002]